MILEHIETGEQTVKAFDDVIISHGFDRENTLLEASSTQVACLTSTVLKALAILLQY